MNIRWYIDRLRSMSFPEIIHRMREAAKRSAWRSYRRGWVDFDIGDGHLPIIPELGRRLEAASNRDPALRQRIGAESRLLLAGDISLLNHQWPEGTLANLSISDLDLFLRDPITGRRWPNADAYCFDVSFRNAKHVGDVKYIWEINRLQFLHVAAAEARLNNDRVLADKILDVIMAWMDANPPFRGINWCSGIELALRLITVVIVLSFLGEVSDRKRRVRLRAFVHAHAFWLARYPSLFSSANNHLVAEALGLYVAGSLVPDLPHAEQMAVRGRAILEAEIKSQILDDGVGGEQSPTYTAFSVEMFALAALIGRLAGNPFSSKYEQRLANTAEFLCWLLDEAGCVPAIGDNDAGRVVTLSLSPEPGYVASVAAAIGGLLGREQFLTPHPRDLRTALFDTPEVATTALRKGMRIFATGGYTVVRERHADQPTLLVFDHGPLGYLSIAAHGHADALAVWLHVGDAPVLIDAGTYLYHAGGAWREYLRSTAAHNTVTVQNASASVSAGAFQWRHKAAARFSSSEAGPDWHVDAEHDGYKTRFGVVHHRRISHAAYGFDIADRLSGHSLPRPASIRFLLAPSLVARRDRDGWTIRLPNGAIVSLQGPPGFDIEKLRGQEAPLAGWVSTSFGNLQPAEQLLFNGLLGSDAVITRIAIFGGEKRA